MSRLSPASLARLTMIRGSGLFSNILCLGLGGFCRPKQHTPEESVARFDAQGLR
jgi:hypothetical protein